MKKYEDIINLPHFEPKKHKRMNIYSRAAQFAPFAALTGYDDQVKETARLTEDRIEVDEELKIILNNKLQEINRNILNNPIITIVYFESDFKKSGGKYVIHTGNIKKIDEYRKVVIFNDKTEIAINDVIEIF